MVKNITPLDIINKNATKKNYMINFFLRILYLLPRNKKIWCFGEWSGLEYCDNSKFFFEYMNTKDKSILPIWITRNNDIKKKIENRGYKVYLFNEPKGIYYRLRAGYIFNTNTIYDLGDYDLYYGANIISLWHGMPLKKFIYRNYKRDVEKYTGIKKVKAKIMYSISNIFRRDYSIATSTFMIKCLKEAFEISDENKFWLTGQPRNEILVNNNINEEKIILFAPTYRNGKYNIEEDIEKIFNNNKLREMMKHKNYKMIIKLHLLMKLEDKEDSLIKITKKDDIQELLKTSRILITDYSSLFIDYALTEREMIFYTPDYDEYMKETGLFLDYKEIGIEIENSIEDLINKIEKAINKNYKTSNADKINKIYNEVKKDFCLNIYNEIMKL